MSVVNKSQWPDDLQGYALGKSCRLIALFESSAGAHYVEFDVAESASVNYSADTVDVNCWRSRDLKEQIVARQELTVETSLLFDAFDVAGAELLQRALNRDYFRLGAFTDNGFGPWFWTFASKIDRSEELEGIVKVSATFPCARFLYWYDSCYLYNNAKQPIKLIDDHPLVVGGFITNLPQASVSRSRGNPTSMF